MKIFYEINITDITGVSHTLKKFKGKVLLIVNTASQCGFTSQYKGLEEIYQKYKSKGFEILAFPCNQFGKQEPGSNSEIAQFCELKFKTSFFLSEKIDVNGSNAHPLYKYLTKKLPGLLGIEKIKWNFTKFLIDADGIPVKRFSPQDKPENIALKIEKLL